MSGEEQEQGKSRGIDWSMILVTVKTAVHRFSGGGTVGSRDAREVVDAVIFDLLRRLSHLPLPDEPVAYAKKAAVNHCKKVLMSESRKRWKRRPETVLLGDSDTELADEARLPLPTGNSLETDRLFDRLYKTLTPVQAKVLTEWRKDGCTRRAARELRMRQQSVQSILVECQKKLRLFLENRANPPVPPPLNGQRPSSLLARPPVSQVQI